MIFFYFLKIIFEMNVLKGLKKHKKIILKKNKFKYLIKIICVLKISMDM
jgi:hypothetical protein